MNESTKKRPKRRRAILVFILALVVAWIFKSTWLAWAGNWLEIGQPVSKSDFVLVLPGGTQSRPFVAAAIVKAGKADQVILLGTHARPNVISGLQSSTQDTERKVLIARDMSPKQIVTLTHKSGSTFDDANALRAFLSKNPNSTVQIVTNDFHTRRARWVFRRVVGKRRKNISFVSAQTDGFGPNNWWQSRKGIKVYLSEYAKLFYYQFRYGDGIQWLVIVTILFASAVFIRRRFSKPTSGELTESQE